MVALPSLPVCGTPSSSNANASGETNFPWWLLPAGLSAASALSLLNSYLKQSGSGKVASLAPSGVAVPVPKVIWNKTTVGEWVTRPVRTLVQVTRTILRTIVEAVPRFITVTRQVIDRIVHSEWVTTFRQVAKTFWEKVTERVPLLGLFGKFLGFIWKTFVKPVIRWVTEAIRTLRTRVENVVRWVVEKIQDGWNYITKQISETIREWVEKIEWVKEWVTKEITVPEIVWEMEFVPLPFLNDFATIRRLLQLVATAGLGAISLSMCTTPTPTPTTPTPDVQATQIACMAQTMVAGTQTALAVTPTPIPTITPVPCFLGSVNSKDQLNTNWGFGANENLYNQEILNASASSGVPAWVLKGLIASESDQFNPTSVSSFAAYGLTQITGSGMGFLVGENEEIARKEIKDAWDLMPPDDRAKFPPLPSQNDSWSQWFYSLDPYTLKPLMQNYMLSSVDGKCTPADIAVGRCSQESPLDNVEVQKNVTYGAMILNASLSDIEKIAKRSGLSIESLPDEEKWKMAIANYNLSAGSGRYLENAIQACIANFSWNCVSNQLANNPDTHLAPGYAEKVMNFAQQGCAP